MRKLYFGDLTLELDRLRLIGPNGPIDLRPKTFDVLRYLLDQAGRVVRKNEIIAAVWPDVVVTDESLTRCISEIRHALGNENQSLIRTVQRRGYVFEGHITASEGGDASHRGEGQSQAAATQMPDSAAPAKKQTTVLHVNCDGFFAELSSRHPERALGAYRLIFAELTRICERFGGRVTSISEHGLTALFGAPIASEDHAVQACQAAVEFRVAASRFPSENRSELLGIGIASGETIVTSLAEFGRANTILTIGSASHLARRLSAETRDGILVSSATQERVSACFHTKERPISAEATAAHELVGPGLPQIRFQGMAMRWLTPFVGRDLELEQLKRSATVGLGGHGQIVAVIGEPGVGKSRLLHEFVHGPQPSSCEILVAGAPSHRAPASFQVFSNLIKAHLRIAVEDDAATRRAKAAAAVAELRDEGNIELFACLALIDEEVDDPIWISLDPFKRRERMIAVGKELLLNAARKQPLLVVLEDLHWLDAESQEATNSLIEGIAMLPVLVLVSYRPEYAHKWYGKSYYSQLDLKELADDERRELLTHLLGQDEHAVDGIGMLHRQGNPLFLEELVRSLADAQILEGRAGAYRLVRPIDSDIGIPAAVQAVLSARMDRLPIRERMVLQAASVAGDEMPVEILRHLVRLPERELEAAFGGLQAAEFLYEHRSSTDRSYRFKHALTRSVAYESQLSDQRAALHRAVVSAIEEIYPHRRSEHIAQLAHHAIRGEMGLVAVQYALQAGEKAFARFANREAIGRYEEGLRALEGVPDNLEKQAYAVDIRLKLRDALYPLAEYQKIEAYLLEAERIALHLADPRRLGWISAYLSSLYLTGGRSASEARVLAERAACIARDHNDRKLLVAAQYYLAWAAYISGHFAETERICRSLMGSLAGVRARERFGVVFPAIQSRAYCARALAEQGRFSEAEALARDAVRLAEEFDHPFSLSWSCLALGHALCIRGELDQAEHVLERGFEQCRLWKIDAQAAILKARLGHVRALRRHATEGIDLLESALKDYKSTRMEHFLSHSIVQLGEAYFLANRVEEARTCADEAMALARRRGERGFEALAIRLLGAVATAEARYNEAARHYEDALTRASQLNMRPLTALCQLGLHAIYARMGRVDEGKRSKSAADALLHDMGMRIDGRIEAIALAELKQATARSRMA